MAKPSLTLRNTKGSALTFTEMDTNLTNLRDAVIQVSAGGTTSNIDLNSAITLTAGTGISLSQTSGNITITNTVSDTTNWTANANGTTFTVTAGETVNFSGTGIAITGNAATQTIDLSADFAIEDDPTPTLSANLDVNGNYIKTSVGTTVKVTNLVASEYETNTLTTSGNLVIDANAHSVFSCTLTGNVAFYGFSNPVLGQSVTLILAQPNSGGPYYLTSNSSTRWGGNVKTLSTTNSAIDVINIFYRGSGNYLASINKGFV